MKDAITHLLTRAGELTAHRYAFTAVFAYAAIWWMVEHDTFDWHGGATLAAVLMAFFIQRAAHRDTQALHAKIDALLRGDAKTDNALTHLDEAQPEEISRYRANNADEDLGKRWTE